jgi:hypothetical protein
MAMNFFLFIFFFLPFIFCQNFSPLTLSPSSSSSTTLRASSSSFSNLKSKSLLVGLGGVGGGLFVYWFGYRKLQQQTTKLEVENHDLLEYIKLQTELHQLQEKGWKDQLFGLENAYKELYQDSLERDYEEFKAPDANHDEVITGEEFESYVSKYLQSFPELSESDFPKFEEFDFNENGEVTFNEWRGYLKQQQKKLKPPAVASTTVGDDLISQQRTSRQQAPLFSSNSE